MKRLAAGAAVIGALVLGFGGVSVALADEVDGAGVQELQDAGEAVEQTEIVVPVGVAEQAEVVEVEAVEPAAETAPAPEGEQREQAPTGVAEAGAVPPQSEDPDVPPPGQVGSEQKVTAKITDVVRKGCEVFITVETTGAADFILEVLDDGEVVWEDSWSSSEPGTEKLRWEITKPANPAVAGVGFFVYADGEELARWDPFEYPDDVSEYCGGDQESPGTSITGFDRAKGVEAGATFEMEGFGFYSDEEIEITLEAVEEAAASDLRSSFSLGDIIKIKTVKADSSGWFKTAVTIPKTLSPGNYVLKAFGKTSKNASTSTIKVIAASVLPSRPGGGASAGAAGSPAGVRPTGVGVTSANAPVATLAKTGVDDPSGELLLATSMVAGGALLFLASRRIKR